MAKRKGNKNSIRASGGPKGESRIHPQVVSRHNEEFSFSLKYLDDSNAKFDYQDKDCNYYCMLLHRLRDLCNEKVSTLMKDRQKKKFFRMHLINWSEKRVSENGFSELNEQLQSCEPWQFQLTSNEHGRVHGFFLGSTFYVVWLDPDHKLYPRG